MENLIFEGIWQALIFYGVFAIAYASYKGAGEFYRSRISGQPRWNLVIQFLFLVFMILIASAAITGLIRYGNVDMQTFSFLTTIMLCSAVYGLYKFEQHNHD